MNRRTLLSSAIALAIPVSVHAGPLRPFRMGVTLWPADLTLDAIMATLAFITDQCDMAAPMILGGVPWTEALSGEPYSAKLREELEWRPPEGHRLLLSVGALDEGRSSLAAYFGTEDNQPLPDAFVGLAFDDPMVIAAYSAFCVQAAATMRPDWLVIGIECNILLENNPDAWPAYKRLHRAAYAAVKRAFPDLQVGFSIDALHYIGIDGNNAAVQRAEVLDLAQDTDLIGISLYPHMSWAVPRPIPEDWMDFMAELAQATGKPVAVTESGYTSRDVRVGPTQLFGSPDEQAHYLRLLLTAAERGRFLFVVNFCSHDFEPLTNRLTGEARELAMIWTYTGILEANGNDKPATEVWREAMARQFSA